MEIWLIPKMEKLLLDLQMLVLLLVTPATLDLYWLATELEHVKITSNGQEQLQYVNVSTLINDSSSSQLHVLFSIELWTPGLP